MSTGLAILGKFFVAELLAIARQVLAAQPFRVLVGTEVTHYADVTVELRLAVDEKIKQQHGFAHGSALSILKLFETGACTAAKSAAFRKVQQQGAEQ